MTTANKPSLRWPVAIVGIIVLHVAAMVTVILIATRDRSFAVEPNHYQKALAWDAFSARARASEALGWKIVSRTDAALDRAGMRGLQLSITDRNDKPLTGARVAVLAFPHARGEERIRVDLVEGEAGHYQAHAAMARTGLWELRVVAERGGDSFSSTILHTVGGSP
jgi:nitrogen fixation protein FixH